MMGKAVRAARIALATLLISASTVAHVVPLMLVALAKAVVRVSVARRLCDRWLVGIAESWIGFNSWMLDRLTPTRVVVDEMPPTDPNGHYLVVCNHASWVDIPVLQKIFNRRLPLLRFFLKSQLFWVPFLGLAWWALDFPFMKRYSKEVLAKRPELAGRDIEATRRACRKFSRIPVAVMNFVEGTRFSEAKRAAQDSPYRNLLRPRAGGVGLVLDAMAEHIDTVLDVTLAYSEPRPSIGGLFAGEIAEVRIAVRALPVPSDLATAQGQSESAYRAAVREWINALWADKDYRIEELAARIQQ
jgi:1-acyl-sn-glycerol-3-phosphate acyltransferase